MKILLKHLFKRGKYLIAFSHNPNIPVLTEVDIGAALLIINGKNSETNMYLTVIYSIYDAHSALHIHRD